MNLECLLKGHQWRQVADGARQAVVYQKGDRQCTEYFSGKVFRCLRCKEEKYIGSRQPYAREVKGEITGAR